ncbi:helix-turn-helix transcriptional regulator [Pediococcus acidilactici]|uniref:helix-turn-helix transcriptional regulator n=1 Tax=Pediococcus acidilactici TaxID=1254 RepID=UPI00137BF5D1|nr:helix-turn-helix transcriptional regulator [Pediococcus acidilactici]QHS02864.1 helix-turn-helix transcriptional regulator [Pediococcus acidilactici]
MENSITRRRKHLKLSQAEVAQLAGVTRQTINAIENNKYDPSLSLAFELAHILNTTVDQLFMYPQEEDYE